MDSKLDRLSHRHTIKASSSNRLISRIDCSRTMDACFMTSEHGAVMLSLMYGNSLVQGRGPAVSRIQRETGLKVERVKEVLQDMRHLISGMGAI